jgi:hypothetical protein
MHPGEVFCLICGANSTGVAAPTSGVTFSSAYRCDFCGAAFSDGEKYCRTSGAAVPLLAQLNQAARRTRKKPSLLRQNRVLFSAAALVLAALLLWTVLQSGTGNRTYGLTGSDAFSLIYDSETMMMVFLSGNGTKHTVASVRLIALQYTSDRSSAAFITAPLSTEDTQTTGALSVITENGVLELASSAAAFSLSAGGTSVAYILDPDETGAGTLWVYDLAAESEQKLAENAYVPGGVVISPDGTAVGYVAENPAGDLTGYLAVDGQVSELGPGRFPLAAADLGRLIYYTEAGTGMLFAQKDENPVSLGIFTGQELFFNADHTQMLYLSQNRIYLTEDGTESILVFEANSLAPICPKHAAEARRIVGGTVCVTYDIPSYGGTVWDFGSSLYYLSPDLNAQQIAAYYSQAALSENGRSLLYTASDRLYKINNLSRDLNRSGHPIYDAEEIDRFDAAPDLSDIVFINYAGELYSLTPGSKETLISGNVSAFYITDNDTSYFITREGFVYTSDNGGKRKKADINEETALALEGFARGVLIQTRNGSSLRVYFAKSGGKQPLWASAGVSVLPDALTAA